MIYAIDGAKITSAYNKDGQIISPYNKGGERVGRAISSQFTRTILLDLASQLPDGTQGIACDSITQSIAQLYDGNIYIIDVSDGSFVHCASSFNLGHAHTGQFAPTKTNEQEYPLLYVSGNNATVSNVTYTYLLVVSCTSSSAIMKKIYAIPVNSGLSLCRAVIDFDNSIVYHVAASTYYGTADYTYISAWDMNKSELLDGATYSPAPTDGIYAFTDKLYEFQIPFVPELQSCTFYDGLIVMLSDRTGVENKYYQFVDVEFKNVYMTMRSQIASSELEGVGFLYNKQTGKHDMIVSDRSMKFYRYEFN